MRTTAPGHRTVALHRSDDDDDYDADADDYDVTVNARNILCSPGSSSAAPRVYVRACGTSPINFFGWHIGYVGYALHSQSVRLVRVYSVLDITPPNRIWVAICRRISPRKVHEPSVVSIRARPSLIAMRRFDL